MHSAHSPDGDPRPNPALTPPDSVDRRPADSPFVADSITGNLPARVGYSIGTAGLHNEISSSANGPSVDDYEDDGRSRGLGHALQGVCGLAVVGGAVLFGAGILNAAQGLSLGSSLELGIGAGVIALGIAGWRAIKQSFFWDS